MFKQACIITLIAIGGIMLPAGAMAAEARIVSSEESGNGKVIYTGPTELSWGGFAVGSEPFADVVVGDYLNFIVTDYSSSALWSIYFGGWGQLQVGSDANAHIYNPETGTLSYEITSERLEKLKTGGFYIQGVGFTVESVTLSHSIVTPDNSVNILWTGNEALNWGGVAYVDKSKFADTVAGDILGIKVDGDGSDGWLVGFGGWAHQIGSTDLTFTYEEETSTIEIPLTAEMVEWLKSDGFFISGYPDRFIVLQVYVRRPDEGDGIRSVNVEAADRMVNVYTISGVIVKQNIDPANAAEGLKPGLYVIGDKKIQIR